ncbi:hypothetical protein F511_47284 [Dorcoceras hygrometricum]|uniref:Uncharacterized protein n=1 Tax=Dorcoceras hygrometricum TaxID=472368 RepID=A0A2Z6ZSH2_9LAMI|nr:hypothetical protein F511_47284 [Dorcoceras hygrometricum]
MGGVTRCWPRRRCALDDAWSADERRRWSSDVRWLREIAHDVASRLARCRARCRHIFVVVAPPSAAAPVSLRRCRDGWSDFF